MGSFLDSIVVDEPTLPPFMWARGKIAPKAVCGSATTVGGAGRNRQISGQPIHALAQAPSHPQILFAGTLKGVFQSSDGADMDSDQPRGQYGDSRNRVAGGRPHGSGYRLRGNLAPAVEDYGRRKELEQHQERAHRRLRRVLDHHRSGENPHIYLSACSGIYKSENAGALFRKIQGIPSEARRTRVLMQDPEKPRSGLRGTTEGLYKTVDGGKTLRG